MHHILLEEMDARIQKNDYDCTLFHNLFLKLTSKLMHIYHQHNICSKIHPYFYFFPIAALLNFLLILIIGICKKKKKKIGFEIH